MSMVYRISLRESVSRTVTAGDTVRYPIHLTAILPESDMRALLRAALEREGFQDESDDRMTAVGPAGETLVVDLRSMQVTASVQTTKQVDVDVLAQGGGQSRSDAKAAAQKELERQREGAQKAVDRQAQRLQKELTEQLAAGEAERVEGLNRVVQQVYAEALKRKARQLGDVIEMQESTSPQGQYELVIKVAQ